MISDVTIQRALAAIKSPQELDYFFRALKSPEWIDPLRKEGLFARADPPLQSGDGVEYVRWAPSAYLRRMAPSAPSRVTEVFEKMDIGDNPWVHWDVVDAALNVPADYAVRLTGIECKWIRGQVRIWGPLADAYGKLISRLAREDRREVALQLFRALLEPLPEPRVLSVGLRNAEARIDWGYYERVLKSVLSDLLEHNPGDTLKTLCDLLDQVVIIERGQKSETEGSDLSYIWRPAIEDDEHNHGHGMIDALVTSVRDAAVRIASTSQEDRSRVVSALEERGWDIFRRIAMHVICEGGDNAIKLAEERIMERRKFDATELRHEYARLLRLYFGRLSVESQNLLLGWIDSGYPYLANWAERRKAEKGVEPSEEERRTVDDNWKFERVHSFRESLPPGWKARYSKWCEEFGPPRHSDFVTVTETRWGGVTPISRDELARMSAVELSKYVLAFEPTGGWDEPDIYGLSQELRAAVVMSAGRFSEEAADFKIEAPEYVISVLDGFDEALRAGTSLQWEPLLDLFEWIVRQPREIAGREGREYDLQGRPPGWSWVRASIASMIERALQGDAGVIPFALWEQVWSVLSAITDDPDPAFDGSDEIDSARDPFNLSLNTTRGKAMHAVVRYAVWVARHSPRERPEELRLPRGLDEISGVRPLLERHLDPGIDASPAIRSVYGCYFPVLAAIDPAWALANRERVFPVEGREDRLWQGAWDGYLVNNRVYGFADQLLTEYRRAVERCREFRDEGNSSGQPSKRLAEHIMILFGRGTVTLDGAGLVESFFDRAPPGLQQHALQFVGKSFSGEKPPPAAVFDRFKGLWVWLVERAERSGGGSPQRRALASFGSWFASGHFDPAWSIAELEKALKLAGQIGDAHAVIRSLGNYVGDFAAPTLRCLRAIIESDSQGWEISATVEVVRAILNATVVSSDVGVANEANEIVHLLGRRGFGSFRTLLSKRSG